MSILRGFLFSLLTCLVSAKDERRQLSKSSKKHEKTSSPTHAPTRRVVTPFEVTPLRSAATVHAALRGWTLQMVEDCLEAVVKFPDHGRIMTLAETTDTLLSLITVTVEAEDNGLYLAMDNIFDCVTVTLGLREKSTDLEASQYQLANSIKKLSDLTLDLSQLLDVCADTFTFASDHEAHLMYKEMVVLSLASPYHPETPPPIVKHFPAIAHKIIMTNFDQFRDFWLLAVLTQLVKRESLTVVGTFVATAKRILTPEQYSISLPTIMEACGDMWPMVQQGLVGVTGEYADIDEEGLPPDIFEEPSCEGLKNSIRRLQIKMRLRVMALYMHMSGIWRKIRHA